MPELTINDIQVSASGGFGFEKKKKIKFTYSGLVTKIDMTVDGLWLPVSVAITGEASGFFYSKSRGKGSRAACLAFKKGLGIAKANMPFIREETFDLALGGSYFYDMDVQYTCSGNRTTIAQSGVSNPLGGGGPGWGPLAYNV